ncbi:MAG: hypothetical protein ACREMA_01315 [Longimicrobiales bacterium]
MTDRSGKGGWLAIPGLLVEIEVGGGSDISIGSLYNIDGVGSLSSAGGGTHFKAWQAMSSGQSFNRVILAEVWKPKG